MKVRLTSVAEGELKEAVEFYEAAENGLGTQFLVEVESAVERIIGSLNIIPVLTALYSN